MATLGRKEEIDIFLNSLLLQTYNCFELIIIDQNTDDKVYEICKNYKERINIKHIRSDVRGLSLNRNIGLINCTGDIVAFPDDDCEYDPSTLKNVLDFFLENGHYSFYTCNTKEKYSDKTILSVKKNSTEISIYNFMQTGISFTIFIRIEKIVNFKFDEQMGVGAEYGSAEESDLLLYLLKNHNRGYYHSDVFIFHPYKEDTAEKSLSYGKGYGALFKKAVIVYKFNSLFFIFIYTIIKQSIKLIVNPFDKIRRTSIKARLYGFIYYKAAIKRQN